MAKCSKCGWLAVWDCRERRFIEASELFRSTGGPEYMPHNPEAYKTKCFIRKADLSLDIKTRVESGLAYARVTKEEICKERDCEWETPWVQGFSPKEHQEMLDRKSERRWRLVEGLVFATAGGVVALFSQWVVKPAIPVVNISPPAVTVTTPPINVTVQPPETKQPRAKQSIPPTTTHDRKSPPPSQE